MLRRLLLVKTELSSVLEVLQWDNLPNSHWKQIDNMVELLKPFAHYTQLTSSEDTTSNFNGCSTNHGIALTLRANE